MVPCGGRIPPELRLNVPLDGEIFIVVQCQIFTGGSVRSFGGAEWLYLRKFIYDEICACDSKKKQFLET